MLNMRVVKRVNARSSYHREKYFFFYLFNFDLSNFSYSIHKFISQSIVLSNKEILFHIQEKNTFMYEKNNVLFIINNTNNTTSISLPITYQNSNLYCVNCGDDIVTTNNIEVYKYSFYIIEK